MDAQQKKQFLAKMKTQKPENWKTGLANGNRYCIMYHVIRQCGYDESVGLPLATDLFDLHAGRRADIYTLNDASSSMKEAHEKVEAYIKGLD